MEFLRIHRIFSHLPLGKRIGETERPSRFVGRQFMFGEQAFIEHCDESFLIHVATDQDEFLTAVAIAVLPNAVDMVSVLGPVPWREGGPEISTAFVAGYRTCLRTVA